MRKNQLLAWLFDNGNPVIRHLVATELARSSSGYDTERLEREARSTDVAAYWLKCLHESETIGSIHGSRDTCFENAAGKLDSFGIRRYDGVVERRNRVVANWLGETSGRSVIDRLIEPIAASFLARAGYWDLDGIKDYWTSRVDYLSEFAEGRDYSIYIDKSQFGAVPKSFKDKRLVDPALYPDARLRLPWIYDIYAFVSLRDEAARPELTQKIDCIVDYVLDPGYQEFPKGYGIIMPEPGRYYALGWAVWLPGFHGFEMDPFEFGCLVQRMEIMSNFPKARASEWFASGLAHLEAFKTDKGTYLFPKEYLPEKKNGYFITGAHMGLGEDRRKKAWREIESTFWMLRIKAAT